MKLDRTLILNAFASLVLVLFVFYVIQFAGGSLQGDSILILFFLFLIFLELERKKR